MHYHNITLTQTLLQDKHAWWFQNRVIFIDRLFYTEHECSQYTCVKPAARVKLKTWPGGP